MSVSTEATIRRLVAEYGELAPVLDESLEDNEGELLPHLVLADMVRWLAEHVQSESDTCCSILDWLEREYERGPEEVRAHHSERRRDDPGPWATGIISARTAWSCIAGGRSVARITTLLGNTVDVDVPGPGRVARTYDRVGRLIGIDYSDATSGVAYACDAVGGPDGGDVLGWPLGEQGLRRCGGAAHEHP